MIELAEDLTTFDMDEEPPRDSFMQFLIRLRNAHQATQLFKHGRHIAIKGASHVLCGVGLAGFEGRELERVSERPAGSSCGECWARARNLLQNEGRL